MWSTKYHYPQNIRYSQVKEKGKQWKIKERTWTDKTFLRQIKNIYMGGWLKDMMTDRLIDW